MARNAPLGPSPATYWKAPAYLPGMQPALNRETVGLAEKRMGCRLPEALLELLGHQNGGAVRYALPDAIHERMHGIGPLGPSIDRCDWSDDQEYVSFSLDRLFAFDGDGHWHMCLDYRGGDSEPAITYVDIECDGEEPIAPSFEAYLDMLRIEVGGERVLLDVQDIEQAKRSLAGALGIEFEAAQTRSRGYPLHKALYGQPIEGRKAHPQLWITPNDVPWALEPDVAETHPWRHQLEAMWRSKPLGTTAPRYPELPSGSFLLEFTAGIGSDVLRAAASAGLTVADLVDFV